MTGKKSFYTWLQQFIEDDNAVGDLDRDALADNRHYGELYGDSGFPRHSKDRVKIREHLAISRNASDNCLKTFDSVFPSYIKYLENLEIEKQ